MRSDSIDKKTIPNGLFFEWVEQSLLAGENVRLTVRGNSMRPILRDGRDEALIEPWKDASKLAEANIFLFRYNGAYVMHRLVRRDADLCWMQGDNVYGRRECCKEEDIVGVVSCVYRKRGETYREVDPRACGWIVLSRLRWIRPIIGRVLRKLGLR